MERTPERLAVFLKETMILKDLSPEKTSPYIGCSSRQIRRWIEGEVNPSPVHVKAIEAGIRKINREIPGDTPDGLVSWRKGPEPSDEEKNIDGKVTAFLVELVKAARKRGKRTFTHQEDEDFLGFEETCHLAKRLKVELPVL